MVSQQIRDRAEVGGVGDTGGWQTGWQRGVVTQRGLVGREGRGMEGSPSLPSIVMLIARRHSVMEQSAFTVKKKKEVKTRQRARGSTPPLLSSAYKNHNN